MKWLLVTDEVEATVACLLADVHFYAAHGTFLLAPNLWQLFGNRLLLGLRFLFRLELLLTRCIGLLHGALRMDTTRGVRPLSTNRTDLRVVFTRNWRGLSVTHDLPGLLNCECSSNSHVLTSSPAQTNCSLACVESIDLGHGGNQLLSFNRFGGVVVASDIKTLPPVLLHGVSRQGDDGSGVACLAQLAGRTVSIEYHL